MIVPLALRKQTIQSYYQTFLNNPWALSVKFKGHPDVFVQ